VAYIYLKGKRIGLKKPEKSQKMKPRAVKGHLVGYEELRGHIFKIWILEKKVVVRARDVRFFDENNNNDEEIQHLMTFQEPQEEEEDEREKEKLPHFTLSKIQSDKTTPKQ
jgi:hypothetical protein